MKQLMNVAIRWFWKIIYNTGKGIGFGVMILLIASVEGSILSVAFQVKDISLLPTIIGILICVSVILSVGFTTVYVGFPKQKTGFSVWRRSLLKTLNEAFFFIEMWKLMLTIFSLVIVLSVILPITSNPSDFWIGPFIGGIMLFLLFRIMAFWTVLFPTAIYVEKWARINLKKKRSICFQLFCLRVIHWLVSPIVAFYTALDDWADSTPVSAFPLGNYKSMNRIEPKSQPIQEIIHNLKSLD